MDRNIYYIFFFCPSGADGLGLSFLPPFAAVLGNEKLMLQFASKTGFVSNVFGIIKRKTVSPKLWKKTTGKRPVTGQLAHSRLDASDFE